jgi:hypothetical protein
MLMSSLKVETNTEVDTVFEGYPANVKKQMKQLRELVFKAAAEIDGLQKLEETLKWGEPSYLTKYSSTVRMDWKAKSPNQYARSTQRSLPTKGIERWFSHLKKNFLLRL